MDGEELAVQLLSQKLCWYVIMMLRMVQHMADDGFRLAGESMLLSVKARGFARGTLQALGQAKGDDLNLRTIGSMVDKLSRAMEACCRWNETLFDRGAPECRGLREYRSRKKSKY